MTKFGYAVAALLAGSIFGAAPALAQSHAAASASTPAVTPLETAFRAADMGDLGPLMRALPMARGDMALLIRGRLAVARFDAAPVDPAVMRIAAGQDPALRLAALSILTIDALHRNAFEDASRWGRALSEAFAARGDVGSAMASAHEWQAVGLLTGRPLQTLEGAVAHQSIPARTDRVGLPRIDVAVNGQSVEAIFDTGSSLSVLSAATARRLGVTVTDAQSSVGNGVQGSVAVRLGIADRLEIAGTMLRNVPFLIIDDSQLTFPIPGGYEIRAIIGVPVMRVLGRMRMESGAGRFTVLAPDDAPPVRANLIAGADQISVTVAIDGQEVPLHFDTGANQNSLSALYAAANPTRIGALATSEARTASAGGTASARVATWRDAPLTVAGRALVLPALPIALPVAGAPLPRTYGSFGSEALRAFESYTIDFKTMRLDLGPPVPAPAPTAASH